MVGWPSARSHGTDFAEFLLEAHNGDAMTAIRPGMNAGTASQPRYWDNPCLGVGDGIHKDA